MTEGRDTTELFETVREELDQLDWAIEALDTIRTRFEELAGENRRWKKLPAARYIAELEKERDEALKHARYLKSVILQDGGAADWYDRITELLRERDTLRRTVIETTREDVTLAYLDDLRAKVEELEEDARKSAEVFKTFYDRNNELEGLLAKDPDVDWPAMAKLVFEAEAKAEELEVALGEAQSANITLDQEYGSTQDRIAGLTADADQAEYWYRRYKAALEQIAANDDYPEDDTLIRLVDRQTIARQALQGESNG